MKKLFLWILFVIIVFFIATQVSREFQAKVLILSDGVKIGILNLNQNVVNLVTRHFNQAQHIKELSNALKDKDKIQYAYNALKSEYDALLKANSIKEQAGALGLQLLRMISFAEINNYTKIWLEHKGLMQREEAIFGLISDNKVAGIATFDNDRLMGYLNGNEKCSYSVVIGENRTLGVVKYDINKGFVADYIPLFPKVEVGDLVYTSGFDEIFYPDILVGSVEFVEEQQGYQVVTIKPALAQVEQFYWLIDIDNLKPVLTLEEEEEQTQGPTIFNFK